MACLVHVIDCSNGKRYELTASRVEKLAALVLEEYESDKDYMTSGRRNDDTVNTLICCKILGKNSDEFIKRVLVEHGSPELDIQEYACYEHIARIEPYLDYWCKEEEEYFGYTFIIYDLCVKRAHHKYFGKEN